MQTEILLAVEPDDRIGEHRDEEHIPLDEPSFQKERAR